MEGGGGGGDREMTGRTREGRGDDGPNLRGGAAPWVEGTHSNRMEGLIRGVEKRRGGLRPQKVGN